ncbi:dienelactone hydrolase [Pelomonas aquatica]|uniref:Dienelactone hydrolase n=1 Tax=Pelomonas aquatica TaxID=431058 RepID=A0ABU1Z6G8_9BURK|nr:acyl-CoA thioesterase/bile acid-CoA:amino acid N-acyltransferase family protein [Pelomonas aquatica]MDR7296212.1 dienelactone hydrolase [Pelomonas aquatica]
MAPHLGPRIDISSHWLRLTSAALVATWAATALAEPSLHVEPGPRVLAGEPVHLSVIGAQPGAEVRLTAERWFAGLSVQRPKPRLMRSEAVFTADPQGRVDLRIAQPSQGSYQGADPRGLFWSMLPVAGVERPAADSVDTTEVHFTLHSAGARSETRLQLLPSLPEVRTQPADGLPGAVFAILPGAQKRPAVILLGGSEGGSLITRDAAPLASHGLAVLALPVFSPPDRAGVREIPELPAAWADLPVETLNKARDWLARRPDVDATRIAVHGTSMGALLALLGGVHLPWVSAVVANVPSDVVWDGWGPGVPLGRRSTFSVAGRPLPFVSLVGYEEELQGFERNEPVMLRRAFERGRAARPDLAAQARVPVERIRVPVMVIGAYDDQMWPSGQMAQAIAERRAEAGLATEALLFPDAGHLLYDTGYAPTTGYNAGLRKTGGTPAANARAQAEVWPRTVQFLRRVLAAGDDPAATPLPTGPR